jgi:hypothetical protein
MRRTDFVSAFVTSALNFDASRTTATGEDLQNAVKANASLVHKVEVGLHFATVLMEKSNGAVDSAAYRQAIDALAGVNDTAASVEDAVVKIDLIGGSTGFGSAVAQADLFG